MNLYTSAKRFVPLPLKKAAHRLLRHTTRVKPYAERRACLQLHQPFCGAHEAVRLVALPGFSLYALTNDYIAQGLMGGTWEPHVTKVIEGLLKEGDTFLDVGANLGYFTLLASRLVGPRGHVIAVEANPQNVQLLCASLIENRAENVTLYPVAASDSETVLKFVAVGSNSGVVNPWSRDPRYHFLSPSARLDRLLCGERVDVMKIDVEGHEPFALRGMERTLREHRPKLVTEFHPWVMRINNREEAGEYLRQLLSYGYRLSVITPTGDLVDAPSEAAVTDYWRALRQEKTHVDLLAVPA